MSIKNNIQIETEPMYIEVQSEPEQNRFVFAYTITITNRGLLAAQLMSRHWLIIDSNGKIQQVKGEGVIGEKPYLKPGEAFRYTSGAMIETPVGVMQGKYIMVSEDGDNFTATIPQFTLSIPRILH